MSQLSQIKDMFATQANDSNQFSTDTTATDTSTVTNSQEVRKQNYRRLGFTEAGIAKGNLEALVSGINAACGRIENEISNDENIQKTEKLKIQEQINRLTAERQNKECEKEAKQTELKKEKQKIEDCENIIDDIKSNPETIIGESNVQAKFIMGCLILLPLTIYLIVFYSSASYSAFFKEFNPNEGEWAAAIFDAKAFSHAFYDGFSELLLITTIPFVFLGLGYLIHTYSEQENISSKFKIAALIVVTFIFDSIIAYVIEEKIYNIKQLNSPIELPPFDFATAFVTPGFWLIIFSGFVVYVIWGFVFNFTMEAFNKRSPIVKAIANEKNKIERFQQNCTEIEEKIIVIEKKINDLTAEIKTKEIKLQMPIIPVAPLTDCLNCYLNGFIQYLSGAEVEQNKITEAQNIGRSKINEITNNKQNNQQ